MGPPKCKTCGKEEWGHICRGTEPAEIVKAAISIERKEYLKLKARERRARQKAGKEAK